MFLHKKSKSVTEGATKVGVLKDKQELENLKNQHLRIIEDFKKSQSESYKGLSCGGGNVDNPSCSIL